MTEPARLVVLGPVPSDRVETLTPNPHSSRRKGSPEPGQIGRGGGGLAVPLAAVLLTAVVVQVAVAPHLAVGGAAPDLLLLAVAAVATARGRAAGAAFGFAAGLTTDLFLATPAGISAFVFTLVGHTTAVAVRSAGGGSGGSPRTRLARWRAAALVAGVTSVAGGLLVGVAATVAGGVPFPPAAALVGLAAGAVVSVVLAAPVFAAVAAATGGGPGEGT